LAGIFIEVATDLEDIVHTGIEAIDLVLGLDLIAGLIVVILGALIDVILFGGMDVIIVAITNKICTQDIASLLVEMEPSLSCAGPPHCAA